MLMTREGNRKCHDAKGDLKKFKESIWASKLNVFGIAVALFSPFNGYLHVGQ